MGETQLTLSEEQIGGDGEAELTEWLAADGARVAADEPVATLSTAKAIIDVEAPVAGQLHHLLAAGAIVVPGAAIATIAH